MHLLRLVIFYLILIPIPFVQASFIDTEAETAVIIDATTGKVLFEKEMNKKTYPASMTKIMTTLIVFENSLEDNANLYNYSKEEWFKFFSDIFYFLFICMNFFFSFKLFIHNLYEVVQSRIKQAKELVEEDSTMGTFMTLFRMATMVLTAKDEDQVLFGRSGTTKSSFRWKSCRETPQCTWHTHTRRSLHRKLACSPRTPW